MAGEYLIPMSGLKVERLIDQYDLEDVGDQLEAHWTGDGAERYSLRTLEEWFNKRVLRAVLQEAEVTPMEGEVENFYRMLTSDNVSSGVKAETRNRLKREGVDTKQLQDDFVSYQAIRTYLRGVRNVTAPSGDGDRLKREIENIQRLENRMVAVAESKIESFRDGGQLSVTSPRVSGDIRVLCEECGTRYSAVELLENGTCECQS